jgi:hypothetical protein
MLVYRPARSLAVACGGPTYTNMYETRNETTNLSGPGARRARSPLLDSAPAALRPRAECGSCSGIEMP